MRAFLVDEDVDQEGVARVHCDVNVRVAAANKGRRSQGPAVRASAKVGEASPLFRLYLAIWWRSVEQFKGSSTCTLARERAARLASDWLDNHVAAAKDPAEGARQLEELGSRVRTAVLRWATALPADATLNTNVSDVSTTAPPGSVQTPAPTGDADAFDESTHPDIFDQSIAQAIASLADATWGLATQLKVLQQVGLRLHTSPNLTNGLPSIQALVVRAKQEHAEHKQGRGTYSQTTAFLRESLLACSPIPSRRCRQPTADNQRIARSYAATRSPSATGDAPPAPTRASGSAAQAVAGAPAATTAAAAAVPMHDCLPPPPGGDSPAPGRRRVRLSATHAPHAASAACTTAVAAAFQLTTQPTDTVVRAQYNNLPDRVSRSSSASDTSTERERGPTAGASVDGTSSGPAPALAAPYDEAWHQPPPVVPASQGFLGASGSAPTSSRTMQPGGHDPPTLSDAQDGSRRSAHAT